MEKLRKAMMIVFVVGIFITPVIGIAGDLEPSGAPAPTMKTLDQIPPTWSQKLPAAQRFELVLDGAAVLDKETGLVWEKSPPNSLGMWGFAETQCRTLVLGGRMGWHLPTVEQLTSLVEVIGSGLQLPSGHPFDTDCTSGGCVRADNYWTQTTARGSTQGYAYTVNLGNGISYVRNLTTDSYYHWCVRGGQTFDGAN